MVDSMPFIALDLRWRVTEPIDKVPYFQGALWSGMLRHAYRAFLKPGESFHQTGLRPLPRDYGINGYRPGQRVHLGLVLPVAEAPRLAAVIAALGTCRSLHGQFTPGVTLRLEAITCRRSGLSWPKHTAEPVDCTALMPLAKRLVDSESFTLAFTAPLRLKKSPGHRRPGHFFGDLAWFRDADQPLAYLFRHLLDPEDAARLTLLEVRGWWREVDYGRPRNRKHLGGFVGYLRISGKLSLDGAMALIRNQWLGLGLHSGFGLGQYRILDLVDANPLRPMATNVNLWREARKRICRDWDPFSGLRRKRGPRVGAAQSGAGLETRLNDAVIRKTALAVLANALAKAAGRPKCRYLQEGQPMPQAVGITICPSGKRPDHRSLLAWLGTLFPGDPVLPHLKAWQADEAAASDPVWGKLSRALIRGLLQHEFARQAIHLPGSRWDLVLAQSQPGDIEAQLKHLRRVLDWLELGEPALKLSKVVLTDWLKSHQENPQAEAQVA